MTDVSITYLQQFNAADYISSVLSCITATICTECLFQFLNEDTPTLHIHNVNILDIKSASLKKQNAWNVIEVIPVIS